MGGSWGRNPAPVSSRWCLEAGDGHPRVVPEGSAQPWQPWPVSPMPPAPPVPPKTWWETHPLVPWFRHHLSRDGLYELPLAAITTCQKPSDAGHTHILSSSSRSPKVRASAGLVPSGGRESISRVSRFPGCLQAEAHPLPLFPGGSAASARLPDSDPPPSSRREPCDGVGHTRITGDSLPFPGSLITSASPFAM